MTFEWSRITVRESSHISFFRGGDPFCELVQRSENTYRGADRFAWMTSGFLPFSWATSVSLPSVQNYRPYIVFSSPMREYEHPLRLMYFLFMAGYRNLHTSFFVPVICWSYLQTEISGILTIILYFSLSCETTLLMLSCDCIESAKFIHGTSSLTKLVYYNCIFTVYLHGVY